MDTATPTLNGSLAATDKVGQVETQGIDFIPESERHSKPRDLAWAMFSPQFGLGNMVFGSFGIAFGLGWWSAVTAITVGCLVGTLIFAGMATVAPKTGTNNAVSSGAFFGITGRFLGSAISVLIALAFFAIIVWTSGQTVVLVAHRIFGSGTGNVALSIAMAAVCAVSFLLAIYGHATLIAVFKFMAVWSFAVLVLCVIVLAGKFHAVDGGEYLLGSFWPTWALTAVLAASLPGSWGPFIGDYGRYVPSRASGAKVAGFAAVGLFAGCWLSELVGAYVTTTFADPFTPFATGFTAALPLGVAILLLLGPGALTNIEAAAMSVYTTGLSLNSLFWRVGRVSLTLIMSIVGLAVSYVALIAFDAIHSIEALASIWLVTVVPWQVIITVGHFMRHGRYNHRDLQAFATPGHRGIYWFTAGFNLRAVVAWAVAVGLGLLFVSTSIMTGPLVKHVDGIDLSFIVAGVVGGALYWVLCVVFPEPQEVRAPVDPMQDAVAVPAIAGD